MRRFSNILFVANPGSHDSAALSRAVELATNNQAQLTVVGLVAASDKEKTASDGRTKELLDAIVVQRLDELQSLVQGLSCDAGSIEVKVPVGTGFLEIIREVLRHQRDLVIKGIGTINGLAQHFSGIDMKLLRKCPCPIWGKMSSGVTEIMLHRANSPVLLLHR